MIAAQVVGPVLLLSTAGVPTATGAVAAPAVGPAVARASGTGLARTGSATGATLSLALLVMTLGGLLVLLTGVPARRLRRGTRS